MGGYFNNLLANSIDIIIHEMLSIGKLKNYFSKTEDYFNKSSIVEISFLADFKTSITSSSVNTTKSS